MHQKPTRALLACLFLPFDSDYSIVSVQLEPDNKDTSLAPRYVCTIHRYQKLPISFITTGLFKLLYTFPFFVVVVVCFCVVVVVVVVFWGGYWNHCVCDALHVYDFLWTISPKPPDHFQPT